MCSATEVRSGKTELGLLNLEKGRLEEGTGRFTEVYESLIGGVKKMKLDIKSRMTRTEFWRIAVGNHPHTQKTMFEYM